MGKMLRKYSPEFKREAVRLLVESSRPGMEVASELGIPSGRLHEWRRQWERDPDGAFPGKGGRPRKEVADLRESELRRLHRELARVREERDILKKALAIFSVESP